MNIPIFSVTDYPARAEAMRRPWHVNYLAMYSSIWGGIVTDPVLMSIPVDDHLVHRADGVFDVFKCLNGRAYCLKEHIKRLERSAQTIDLALPKDFPSLLEIIRATVAAGGIKDVLVRLTISRGPGGFSTNPFECPASQLYVTVIRLKQLKPRDFDRGVPIVSSPVPIKSPPYATIKSCDYLLNVMIKKAAITAGVEFAVTWDWENYLAEGSTENILIVSDDGELLVPKFDRILIGVTLTRVMALAERLIDEGLLTGVRTARIDRNQAVKAREVMLCGTSLDVLPVNSWDGRPVGNGHPGPVARRLLALIRDDQINNEAVLTDIYS